MTNNIEVMYYTTEQLRRERTGKSDTLGDWIRRSPNEVEFSPSSASVVVTNQWGEPVVEGTCLRKQYYLITDTPPDDIDPDADDAYAMSIMRRAAYGDCISSVEVDLAKKAGIYYGHEVAIKMVRNGVRISGRADLLCKIPLASGNHEKVVTEIKSIGSYYARKGTIIASEDAPYMPKIGHALQAAIYLDFLRKHDFTHAQIIYIDRGEGDYSNPAHKIFVDAENNVFINGKDVSINLSSVYNRWVLLAQKVADKQIPDRDFQLEYSEEELQKMADRKLLNKTETALFAKGKLTKGHWACGYCEFKNRCWNLGDKHESK